MAVKKSSKTASSVPRKPRQPLLPPGVARKIILNGLGVVLFGGVIGGSFYASYRYVKTDVARSDTPPKILLVDRPAWMTDVLADKIISSVGVAVPASPFDHQLLENRAKLLADNPWVKSVRQVRRTFEKKPGDTIEVQCEFRTPVAIVRYGETYWYVDNESVKLPEQFTGEEALRLIRPAVGSASFRLIEGVTAPPPLAGRKWAGDDLKAGLELLALLAEKPYAKEINKIDVSNYNGRVKPNEAQLVCLTRYGSEIRWGQPVSAKAFFVEVRVEQKLALMAANVQRTGRVDMNLPWIDLRFDGGNGPQSTQADAQR